MLKYKKLIIGGIESKLLLLFVLTILLLSGAFFCAGLYQNVKLSQINAETNEKQIVSISEFSDEMVEKMVAQEILRSSELEAMVTNETLVNLSNRVSLLADYATKLFANPENYPRMSWELPDPSKAGTLSTMVVPAPGTDISDPDVADTIGLIANMSDMMVSLCKTFGAENAYIGLPEGFMLNTSSSSDNWYEEDGSLQPFDPRERYWYKEAADAGKLVLTDVGSDRETGQLCIACAMPVYYPDGKLAAVIGSDFYLTQIQESVEQTGTDDEFQVITNQRGEVIFSPKEDGEFRQTGVFHDIDSKGTKPVSLRDSDNEELAAFMTEVMKGKDTVGTISLSDGRYFIAGSSISSIGWTQLAVYSQRKASEAKQTFLDKYKEIQLEAVTAYITARSRSNKIIIAILTAIIILMMVLVIRQARVIVEPLNTITNRISEIGKDNLEFRMEDSFRTGDEIEILAESFADMTRKNIKYIAEAKYAAAETERISTELDMARHIQSSLLPGTFPAFPDCKEIDIYATMTPAKEVGGDFYDFFFIDPDHLAMVIADVSGKGVPAALFMMISRTIIKNCAMLKKDAAQILEEANKALCSENLSDMFVTVWIGILELSTGLVTTANAGHEYPAIYHAKDGKFRLQRERHSLVLGGLEGIEYKEQSFMLYPGDKIFVYTDGVPEAENSEQEFFGTNRMIKALDQAASGSPEAILGSVRKAVGVFVGDSEQFDDLTMLCVEYKGPPGS